jgi:hypothetical protein
MTDWRNRLSMWGHRIELELKRKLDHINDPLQEDFLRIAVWSGAADVVEGDFVVGGRLVSEWDTEELHTAYRRCWLQYRCLQWLLGDESADPLRVPEEQPENGTIEVPDVSH